jgi:hypothetical protein
MKRLGWICLFSCLNTTFLLSQSNPVAPINQTARAEARIRDLYGKLPLTFEANHGQTDARVKFLSHTRGYTLFLTGDEAVLALRGNHVKTAKASSGDGKLRSGMVAPTGGLDLGPMAATTTGSMLRMKLRNANPAAKVTGADELTGTSNYFIGDDPAKWRTNVPTYAKVKYEGIYSGIDLVYYGNQRQLEYDFIVAPGADPRRIAFDVRGARRMSLDQHGDLVLKMDEGEIRWHKPTVYQEKNGTRQEIAARYAITDTNRVGFEVAGYDASKPLYIDPLIYSTYLGGTGQDIGNSIAVDRSGNAYVTGSTASTDFPTMNPLQSNYGGNFDAFVAKINPAGSAFVYSTYLGGSGIDTGNSIAVDSTGDAYVIGETGSTNFPTTPGAFQTTCNGGNNCSTHDDAFVTKINPTGSALVYSTYLGGSGTDTGNSIAVDSSGNAYVTGSTTSTDFPTMNPLQPNYGGGYWDAFVAKINPTGSALVYSTYLGGSGTDKGNSIAVDGSDNAHVTGSTLSPDFRVTPGAFHTTYGGGLSGDGFVTKFNSAGSALAYSAYFGAYGDYGTGIAVDSADNAYVTGYAGSFFPTTPGAFQTSSGGAFVAKINPTGAALVYSTYLGTLGHGDHGSGIAVDSAGTAYVVGSTGSPNFPTTPGAFQTTCSCGNGNGAFVTRFNPSGSALIYSTYLAGWGGGKQNNGSGIAVDTLGDAYVTGWTTTTHFPTKNPLQPTFAGYGDAFVTKLQVGAVTKTMLSSSPNPSTYGEAVTFTAMVTSYLGMPPDGEKVTFQQSSKVLGIQTLSGGSASFLTSALPRRTNTITAVYGGDAIFAASTSNAVSQVVSTATTTTTLVSSLNPSNFGQSVTFTASVTPQFGGKVTGTVTFYDGTTALKTVSLSGGTAKFTTSTLTSGKHSITATYSGSTNFNSSSASLTQTVN